MAKLFEVTYDPLDKPVWRRGPRGYAHAFDTREIGRVDLILGLDQEALPAILFANRK